MTKDRAWEVRVGGFGHPPFWPCERNFQQYEGAYLLCVSLTRAEADDISKRLNSVLELHLKALSTP